VSDVFGDRSAQWATWQAEPWARLRYDVVGRVLPGLLDRPGRVLDVGGGDGADCVPLAAAGNDITVLDPSAPLLERAAGRGLRTVHGDLERAVPRSEFDLVLCHNVLHYLDDVPSAVSRLTGFVAPGGALSLMAPNPAMDVLSAAVRRLDPTEALAVLDSPTVHGRTFDHPMNRLEPAVVEAALVESGFRVERRFGVRCVMDLVADDDRKSDPDFYDSLLELELALCERDPYRATARFWLLVARSGTTTETWA